MQKRETIQPFPASILFTIYNFYMLFPSYVRTQELETEEQDDEDEWDEEAKEEIAQDAGATAETEDKGDTGEAVVKKDDENPKAVVKKKDEKPEAVVEKEDEKPEAVVEKDGEKPEAVVKKSDDAKPKKDQKVARRLFDEKDPVAPEETKVFDEEPPKSKLWDQINQEPAEEKIVEKVPEKTLDGAAQEQPKKDDAVKEQEKTLSTSVVFIVFWSDVT